MFAFVKIVSGELQLSPGQKILKSSDYMNYLQSDSLIDIAQNNVDEIINEASNIYQQEKARGYKDGKLQAQNEFAELMQEAVIRCNKYYIDCELQIVQSVIDCVSKVISDFDDVEIVRSIVQDKVDILSKRKQIILHVSPSQVDGVKSKVSQILSDYTDIEYIDVVADKRLKESGGCIFETEIDIIDASISTQLTNLEQQINECYKSITDENFDDN